MISRQPDNLTNLNDHINRSIPFRYQKTVNQEGTDAFRYSPIEQTFHNPQVILHKTFVFLTLVTLLFDCLYCRSVQPFYLLTNAFFWASSYTQIVQSLYLWLILSSKYAEIKFVTSCTFPSLNLTTPVTAMASPAFPQGSLTLELGAPTPRYVSSIHFPVPISAHPYTG